MQHLLKESVMLSHDMLLWTCFIWHTLESGLIGDTAWSDQRTLEMAVRLAI